MQKKNHFHNEIKEVSVMNRCEPIAMELRNEIRHPTYSVSEKMPSEEDQKTIAASHLMHELNAGTASGEKEGWLNDPDLSKHFRESRNQQ